MYAKKCNQKSITISLSRYLISNISTVKNLTLINHLKHSPYPISTRYSVNGLVNRINVIKLTIIVQQTGFCTCLKAIMWLRMIRTSLRNWGCPGKGGKYSPVMMIIRSNPISKVTTMKKVKVYINSKTITTINQNMVHLNSQIHQINPISQDLAKKQSRHSNNVKKEYK